MTIGDTSTAMASSSFPWGDILIRIKITEGLGELFAGYMCFLSELVLLAFWADDDD